eukprot:SAG11_NODE_902_length_6620_cov_3.401012_3_plen_135_part_00
MPFGGRDITRCLASRLGIEQSGVRADRVPEELKKRFCFCGKKACRAFSPSLACLVMPNHTMIAPPISASTRSEFTLPLSCCCAGVPPPEGEAGSLPSTPESFKLPDGKKIEVGKGLDLPFDRRYACTTGSRHSS